MKFEKALEVFGIPHFPLYEDYSFGDVIRIYYKKVISIYNRDFTDIKDQLKELNDAKDCLLKHLLERKINEENLNETEAYREQKIMEVEFSYAINKKVWEKMPEVIEIIEMTKTCFDEQINEIKNIDKKTIDFLCVSINGMLLAYYKKIALNYGWENNTPHIDSEYINKIIDDKCSLFDLWRRLEVYKKSKSELFDRYRDEAKKYGIYGGENFNKGYDRVKIERKISEKYRDELIFEYKENGYVDLEKYFAKMNEEITNETDQYAKIDPQPEELERILDELGSRKLLNEYYAFLKTINFNSESTVSFVQNGVNDLLNEIEEYKRKKEIFQANKSIVAGIRESLIQRCPKKYINGKLKILQLEKLGILLNLFDKGYSKFFDIEYFNLFNEITFIDKESDNKVIEKIINNLYPYYDSNVTKSRIYLDKNEEFENGWISYYYLENDREVYRYDRCKHTYEKVGIKPYEVYKNYTSLDEVFNEAVPVRKWVYDYVRSTIFIHYMTDNFIIYSNTDGEVYIRENKGCYAYFMDQASVSEKDYDNKVNEHASKNELQKILEETIIEKEIPYGKEQLLERQKRLGFRKY